MLLLNQMKCWWLQHLKQVWSLRADDRVRGVPRLHEEGEQAEPLLPVRVQGVVLQAQDTPLDHRPHRRGVERETAQKTLTNPATNGVISHLAFQGGLIVLSEEKCPWKINFDPKKGPFINDDQTRGRRGSWP